MTQLSLTGCAGVVLAPDAGPDRDTWCTPRWLAEAIGPVDLDPCTNSRSHIDAARVFRLEQGSDGLALADSVRAECRVWINPPYSHGQVIRWVRAYAHTRFSFLVRLDPSTEWFGELYAASETILVPRGERIQFEPPPGVPSSSNPFPHCIAFARAADVTDALRSLCFEWRTA